MKQSCGQVVIEDGVLYIQVRSLEAAKFSSITSTNMPVVDFARFLRFQH